MIIVPTQRRLSNISPKSYKEYDCIAILANFLYTNVFVPGKGKSSPFCTSILLIKGIFDSSLFKKICKGNLQNTTKYQNI